MKKIIIYTDGGSRGNPGPAAAGAVFCNERGETIKKACQYLGEDITNNEAEYRAVIFALGKFKQLFGKNLAKATEIEIRSDSELMVRQLSGKYKILEPNIQTLFITLWNLKLDFKEANSRLIPRNHHQEADRLVNQALDGQLREQKLL